MRYNFINAECISSYKTQIVYTDIKVKEVAIEEVLTCYCSKAEEWAVVEPLATVAPCNWAVGYNQLHQPLRAHLKQMVSIRHWVNLTSIANTKNELCSECFVLRFLINNCAVATYLKHNN